MYPFFKRNYTKVLKYFSPNIIGIFIAISTGIAINILTNENMFQFFALGFAFVFTSITTLFLMKLFNIRDEIDKTISDKLKINDSNRLSKLELDANFKKSQNEKEKSKYLNELDKISIENNDEIRDNIESEFKRRFLKWLSFSILSAAISIGAIVYGNYELHEQNNNVELTKKYQHQQDSIYFNLLKDSAILQNNLLMEISDSLKMMNSNLKKYYSKPKKKLNRP